MKLKLSVCLTCAALAFIPRVTSFVSVLSGLHRPSHSSSPYTSSTLVTRSWRRHDVIRMGINPIRATSAEAERAAAPQAAAANVESEPGTADLDWENLGFEYRDVNSYVKFTYRDGRWDEGQLVRDAYVNIHIASTGLHYGQSVFEGLKAFHCKDGRCVS